MSETEPGSANENDSQSAVTVPLAAPSSLAFTIDFGQNSDKPEITDHWKHLTPYRVHAGVQQRSTATKSRSVNKQPMDSEIASRKTNKVRLTRLLIAVVTDFLKCNLCGTCTPCSVVTFFLMQAKCLCPDSSLDAGSESLVHCRFA